MNDVPRPLLYDTDRQAAMSSAIGGLADACLLAMVVVLVFPETLLGRVYLFVLPIRFVVFYLALFLFAMEFITLPGRLSGMTVAALVAAVLLTLGGVVREHSTKFLVLDLSVFCGLIAGLFWGTRRAPHVVINKLRRWSGVVCVVTWVSMIAVYLGLVESVGRAPRVYLYSAFRSAGFLVFTCPLLFGAGVASGDVLARKKLLRTAILSVVTVLAVGVATATRSAFLAGVFSLLVMLWIGALQRRGRLIAASLVSLAVIGFLIYAVARPKRPVRAWSGSSPAYDVYLLEKRLEATRLTDETRYLEARSVLAGLSRAEAILGTGFGSRYELPYESRSPIAYAPHIGLLAFLLKGGIPLFVLCVALPAVVALWNMFAGTTEPIRMSCWGGVLAYIASSTMSGGWSVLPLFLYGTFLAMAMSPRRLDVEYAASAGSGYRSAGMSQPV